MLLIVVLLLSHQEALEIQLFGNMFGLQFQKQLQILGLSIIVCQTYFKNEIVGAFTLNINCILLG